MAEWPGKPAEQWPGQEASKESTKIDVNTLTDPHEIDFVMGRRGQMSEQDLEESIRQYRAIKKSDQDLPTTGSTKPLAKIPAGGGDAVEVMPRPEPEPIAPSIPPSKGLLEPRLTWEDLKGASGQNALASGLATMALTPGPFKPAGFVAGAGSALLADEGTRRLQEQYGETTGGIAGMIAAALAGGGAGVAGRGKPMGPFKNVTPPEPIIPPQEGPSAPPTALYETIPRGGAYSATELLTEPSSRIGGGPMGEGQFSTGSGTSLFGEGLEPFRYNEPPRSPYLMEEKFRNTRKKQQEKYPTIQEMPLSPAEAAMEKPPPHPAMDMGGTTPEGTYVPPKEYRVAPDGPRWRQLWNVEKQRWGQEMPVLKTHPTSPVISAVESTHVYVEDAIESFVHQPWLQNVMKMGGNDKMAALEAKWVADFKAGRDYTHGMPEDIKTMLARRQDSLEAENAIRRRRGLSEIHETPGPYLPRLSDEEFKLMRMITRSQEGAKRAQSVGPFAQERIHETMAEGQSKGVTYQDWRKSLLLREARGQVMKATDQMMTDLEKGGVIFRTKEGAEAASLTGKAYKADGLPFEPDHGWWVRSAEERQFLLQNMRQFEGSMGNIRTWANQFMRNPSLINPWPHIVKNMGLKQMQQAVASGLNPAAVLKNTYTYRWGTPDMLDEFKQVMPFTASGRTVWEIMEKSGPKTMVEQMSRAPGILNGYARRKIFAEWDPAMRYGLWREYTKQGMSPQEAANHTWIDLIRYGTRADRIDAWNSFPFNFFVPWRVGTLRTMNKAMQSAPVRFGLFMGAVDLLREYDYRRNGRWTHLPYDYLERPITTLMAEGPTEALKTAATTLILGPGGDYTLRTIKDLIDTVESNGGIGTVRTMAWGLAQMYDLWPQYKAWEKDHNSRHIVDMLGLLVLGRHGTPYGAPHRFMESIPESVIPKKEAVKDTELLREGVKAHAEARKTQKLYRDVERYKEPMAPQVR